MTTITCAECGANLTEIPEKQRNTVMITHYVPGALQNYYEVQDLCDKCLGDIRDWFKI